MLVLLVAPALASACTLSATNSWTGGAGDQKWSSAGNWSAGVPGGLTGVCIPAATAPSGPQTVVVDVPGVAGFVEVEKGAGLAVAAGKSLDVGNAGDSLLAGDLTINNSTLTFGGTADYTGGSILVVAGGVLKIASGQYFYVRQGLDVTDGGGGVNRIANSGNFVTQGTPAGDPVIVGPAFENQGTVVNGGNVLRFIGGASGGGDWDTGSGSGETGLELMGAAKSYTLDGTISDAAQGGVGYLKLDSATLTMAAPGSQLRVYEMTATNNAVLNFAPISAPAGSIGFDVLTVDQGAQFEASAPLAVRQKLVLRDGLMLGSGNWTAQQFHWGGGNLESTSANQSLTVGTLDMGKDVAAGDTGIRQTNQRDLILTGDSVAPGYGFAYADGTFDLAGGADFVINSGARWQVLNDVDVDRTTGAGQIVNHGEISKTTGGAGETTFAPDLNMPDGTLVVNGGVLQLAGPPVQYDAANDTITAGTYVLSGTLRFPGPIASISSGIQFAGGHLENSPAGAGPDALTTITSNAAGNTLALSSNSQIAPGAGVDFTNDGTITLSNSSSINVTGGGNFVQGAVSASSVVMKSAASHVDVAAGGALSLARGTLGGIGTVNGDVVNSGGSLAPGNSPGTLTINGNFTQSGTGIFLEEVNGPAPTDYDRLIVNGTATLGGLLVMQSGNGYEPADAATFDMLQATNRVGTFSAVSQFPAGTWFETGYSPTGLRLTANRVAVSDASVAEGNSGPAQANFTVALAAPSSSAVSVDWATQDGSAVAGSDYTASGGTVTFAPGETQKTVTVAVTGDTLDEADENFAVNLSNPVNTRIGDANGVGTISDDDGPATARPSAPVAPPGDIDGFAVAPPPVQGKSVNVEPVSGKVLVRLPGTTRFVDLPDQEQVPVGTIIDARKGKVRLFSVGTGGRLQSAVFYEGVFQLFQQVGKALTTLKLFGGSFAACPKTSRATASAKRRKKLSGSKSIRHLWGSGSGQFQTQGRYASATIRGTRWLTDDRCNGTLIRVAVGAVTVRDFTLGRALALRAPKTYLAPAAKPRRRK